MIGNTHLVRRSIIACCCSSFVLLGNLSCFSDETLQAMGRAMGQAIEARVVVPLFMGFRGACATHDLWLAEEEWKPDGASQPPRHHKYINSFPDCECSNSTWRLAALEIHYPSKVFAEWVPTIFVMNPNERDCTELSELWPEHMVRITSPESIPDPLLQELTPESIGAGYEEYLYDVYWERVGESSTQRFMSRVHMCWSLVQNEVTLPTVLKLVDVTAFEPQAVSDAHWLQLLQRAETHTSRK